MPARQVERLGPSETMKVRDVIDALFASDAPCQTLHALASGNLELASDAFGRYAAIALRDAGAERLRGIAPGFAVGLEAPDGGKLARFTFKGNPPLEVRSLLADVEDALNRIICVADAVADAALQYSPLPQTSVTFTFRGVDRIPQTPGYRSAKVSLPPLSPYDAPTVAYFCELDWRMLDNVASIGRSVFQGSIKPNLRQAVLGAYAPNGSDWDVRTRMASILSGMELSLRFSARFDCDIQRQTVMVAFGIPPVSSFPHCVPTSSLAEIEPLGNRAELALASYCLRLSCLVACACFGSGRHIERAFVRGRTQTDPHALECAFSRDRFVRTALAAIDDGMLSDADLRFSPAGIADIITADWLHLTCGATTIRHGCKPADFETNSSRIDPYVDERPLPSPVSQLFGAKRVCDMDTRHYHGKNSDSIEDAKRDSGESAVAAVASLEQLLDRMDEEILAFENRKDVRPLYCGNPFARIALPLVADQLSVGDAAESYLYGELSATAQAEGFLAQQAKADASTRAAFAESTAPHGPQPDAACRYYRVPDAIFHAHMGLSDLYQRMGDFSGAAAHADYCMGIAPTTASAYFRKADILAQQTRYAEAANVLIGGLRCAVSKRDCALLYYHLALVLWRMGRKADAAAIQVYTTSLEGEFAEKARNVVASLRKKASSPVIVHASPLAASRELSRVRIPISPSDEARSLIAHAALGLACANAPEAAAPYAAALARILHSDDAIRAACESIQHGIGV